MATIVGIAGSLRKGSYNKSLLRVAAEHPPAGTTVEIAFIDDIPLYNADVEARGIPQAVAALKDRIAAADGLLIVTPEYNGSIPGVLKNTVDWLSRPPADIPRVFGDRPVAIMGATPGLAGTRLSQTAWLPVLRALGTRPWFGRQLYVASAGDVFDANGALIDAKVRQRVSDFMAGFAQFVADS